MIERMGEYAVDFAMSAAFLMEGSCDWEAANPGETPMWYRTAAKDHAFNEVMLPIADLLAAACYVISARDWWANSDGVFQYEVSSYIGYLMAETAVVDMTEIMDVIAVKASECLVATGDRRHPALAPDDSQERRAEIKEYIYRFLEIRMNGGLK